MIIEICNKRINSDEATKFFINPTLDSNVKELTLGFVSGGEIFLFRGTQEQCESVVKRPECQKLLALIINREEQKARTHQGG